MTQGKVVSKGQLWAGAPAIFVRALSPEEVSSIAAAADSNLIWAGKHASESAKTWRDNENDDYEFEQVSERSPHYYQRLTPEVVSIENKDIFKLTQKQTISLVFYYYVYDSQEISFKLGEQENHQVPGRLFDSAGRLI